MTSSIKYFCLALLLHITLSAGNASAAAISVSEFITEDFSFLEGRWAVEVNSGFLCQKIYQYIMLKGSSCITEMRESLILKFTNELRIYLLLMLRGHRLSVLDRSDGCSKRKLQWLRPKLVLDDNNNCGWQFQLLPCYHTNSPTCWHL